MESSRIIAVDLARNVFQACVLERHYRVVCNKTFRRAGLSRWLVRQKPSLVALQASTADVYRCTTLGRAGAPNRLKKMANRDRILDK